MLDDLIYDVNELVNERLNQCRDVRATGMGLDDRCGVVKVHRTFIAVPIHSNQRLRYYGGFEYVFSDHVVTLGGWTFYSAEDGRVRDHLSFIYPDLATEEIEE